MSVGTRMIEMPLCLGASGSVRQASQIQSAFWALEVKTFCPSISQSDPSRTARVRRAARSVARPRVRSSRWRRRRHPRGSGEEIVLLLLGPVLHQGRADGVERDHGDGGTGPVGLVEEDELLVGAAALTAVLDGPAEAEEPVGAYAAQEFALTGLITGEAVRHQVLEVRAQCGAEPQLAFSRGEVHGAGLPASHHRGNLTVRQIHPRCQGRGTCGRAPALPDPSRSGRTGALKNRSGSGRDYHQGTKLTATVVLDWSIAVRAEPFT